MKLTLVSLEKDLVRLVCDGGHITMMPTAGWVDSVEGLLGDGCFSRRVLLDMAKIDYIDSIGLAALVVLHKRFVQSGGCLVLHSLPAQVQPVFDVLRLPLVLNMAPNERKAEGLARVGAA